ncbi:MAG TPA: DUF1788 domain-containing protein [Planctomycetaceae bacterium]|nr:DUF1788 domain-containing protein [Planctomycetaceae bacterium]
MNPHLETSSLSDRFDHLRNLLSSQRFLKCEGLNNEVPFFICPYTASESVEVTAMQRHLLAQLRQLGVEPLHIDLYDMAHEILVREGDWDWIATNETTVPKDKLLEDLQGILDAEHRLIPEISARISAVDRFDILIITGIGEVFPYIRSHTVLNNLQKVAEKKPTLLFFPGQYQQSLEKGASLELFGRLRDDRYYRAFNIFEREI